MKILLTGVNGFIGKNCRAYFNERKGVELLCYSHTDKIELLTKYIDEADFVIHLAGVNRPSENSEFLLGNTDFTRILCAALEQCEFKLPVIFASSTQAEKENPYGESKRQAENILFEYAKHTGAAVYILRLPNVFGKWARPDYNSAVATFCHNISRNLPINVHDSKAPLNLVYIDDVINQLDRIIFGGDVSSGFISMPVVYRSTVGEVAELIQMFHNDRHKMLVDKVGNGFERVLYATYISYLLPSEFSYYLQKHADARGSFVEMLKTKDSGQISFFTAEPRVTRGGHFHHTKTEKFLVVKGEAVFRFRNVDTEEYFEISTSSERPEIVETVPGWAHDITNIGSETMIVMLWANEIFDPLAPDTYLKILA